MHRFSSALRGHSETPAPPPEKPIPPDKPVEPPTNPQPGPSYPQPGRPPLIDPNPSPAPVGDPVPPPEVWPVASASVDLHFDAWQTRSNSTPSSSSKVNSFH